MTDASISPVFLLSTERSGSNLTRSILNTHSEITAPHPLETAYPWRKTVPPSELSGGSRKRLIRDILINKNYSFHPLVETMNIERTFDHLEEMGADSFLDVQKTLYEEYAAVTEASVWVSKDPSEWDYIKEAFEYYDDLKVIYLVRDPRDVVLSFKTSNVGRYHPYFNAKRWTEEQEKGLQLLEDRPTDVHRIRYEDLLQNPESITEELCAFLELEFEPEMLYYYDTDDAQAASQSAEVFENLSMPIKSDNYEKYKDRLPREEIRITEKIAADALTKHGYELETPRETLDSLELSPNTYEESDQKLRRNAGIEDWKENTREKVARFTTRSFSYYMILRYGLLQQIT